MLRLHAFPQSSGKGVLEPLRAAVWHLMPKRHNQKGRSTTERFVSLPHYMLGSQAWRSLSPVARSVFIELAAIYNGSNNGRLALSVRDAAEWVCCSKTTAGRAFAELTDKGFIDLCSRGHFDRKTPHAAEYRLTMHPCDRSSDRASKRFMSWRPDETKSVAGPSSGTAGPSGGTVKASTKENCRELSSTRDRKRDLQPIICPATGTHIIYQLGSGVEVTRDDADAGDVSQSGGHRNAS